jgi:hypothetical protein
MSYIRELYKLFDLTPVLTNDEIEDDNNNIQANKIEKNEQNNYNLLEDIKDDVFEDINDDYINPTNFKTNRYNQITSINLPKNIKEEKSSIPESKRNNLLSLDIIKDIPKYSRIKTNRNDFYSNRSQEEDYNEIIQDLLYISSYKTASTISDLKHLKITNIINCSGDLCENLKPDSSFINIEYLTLNLRDNVSENIECLFFKCINYINAVKEKKGRVLIHCYKGVSRSVSIVIAYLIYLYQWPYDKAFDFVQSKRAIANPNIGFYLQLKTFYKRLTLKSDRLEIFSVSHFYPEQYDLIVCRLIYNNISLKDTPQHKNKKIKNNMEECEELDNDEDDEESDNNEEDEDNIDVNKNNKDKEDNNFEKKEIILNEKGMFIFAMKKNIFIVEGNKISGKNYEIYKNSALDYIKQIKKFEYLGIENDEDKANIIKQDEMEVKYKELINDQNLIIKFSDNNNIDKFYVD